MLLEGKFKSRRWFNIGEQDIRFVSTNGDWQVGTNNGGNGTDNNHFYIYDAGSYPFTISKGTGNVGIGTTSPQRRFHIKCANGTGIGFGNFTDSTTSPGIYLSGIDSHMANLDEPHIWSNNPDSVDNLSFLCYGRHIWYNQDDLIILVKRVKE